MTRKEFKELVNSNKTAIKIKMICEKYGYEANDCYIEFNTPRLWIRALDWKWRNPDISLDKPVCAEEINPQEWSWKINYGCGNVSSREMKLKLFQLNNALKLVEELEELDLSRLPVMPDKFDKDDEE